MPGYLHAFDVFPALLFFVAFFGLIRTDNIVKGIVCVTIMQTAVIMFWLGAGARYGTTPPILGDHYYFAYLGDVADPLPQALMLTAIIIGIAVTAINITMLNALFKKYKTIEWAAMEAAALADPDMEKV